ncbi:MAG TPA: anti-sigma F factor [Lachnospiraceae bacterium]|nr:anti-sigma F factor [Lachnospiraceae bacterium]
MSIAAEKDCTEIYRTGDNRIQLRFLALSVNEALARTMAAAFLSELNPTLEEIADVKTAVSEAVTNAVIHGYGMEEWDGPTQARRKSAWIHMECGLSDNVFEVSIEDKGCGIPDIKTAMQPLYTSRPELERSGMGFSFIEAFMDEVKVESTFGEGTMVQMKKKIGIVEQMEEE